MNGQCVQKGIACAWLDLDINHVRVTELQDWTLAGPHLIARHEHYQVLLIITVCLARSAF